MNEYQAHWWNQARSDFGVFELLMSQGVAECHLLHYLQMCSEKLSKAYFWRNETAPPVSHTGFVEFIRLLNQGRNDPEGRIPNALGFRRTADLRSWIKAALPLAYELERLAPTLAGDGPNPEYPWPHRAPSHAPVDFSFPVWRRLNTGQGREFLRVLRSAVTQFPSFADVGA